MNVVIETNRLLLRTFTTDDAGLIYELNKDPKVTIFTHDPISNEEHARNVLMNVIVPQYTLYGYGRWAVILKQEQAFMGWCGLKYRPERDEIDLGYRYKQQWWGKGYATEAAVACVKYGFENLRMEKIVGRAEPENKASCRVLEKCGMVYQGDELVDGHLARTYLAVNPFITT